MKQNAIDWFKYALMNWRTCGICIFWIFNSCVISLWRQCCFCWIRVVECERNVQKIPSFKHSARVVWVWVCGCMCLFSGFHRVQIMILRFAVFFFLNSFLSFHFQVPYPMFSAIYSAQLTYLLCTHWCSECKRSREARSRRQNERANEWDCKLATTFHFIYLEN